MHDEATFFYQTSILTIMTAQQIIIKNLKNSTTELERIVDRCSLIYSFYSTQFHFILGLFHFFYKFKYTSLKGIYFIFV